MLADGQDEPVTSMPVADNNGATAAAAATPLTNMPTPAKDRTKLLPSGRSVQEIDAKYAEDDEIMNAPSC